tara:strand:+ start:594 stop:818 length:225 start_codon:yes stop_codon:yes gene_type:complete
VIGELSKHVKESGEEGVKERESGQHHQQAASKKRKRKSARGGGAQKKQKSLSAKRVFVDVAVYPSGSGGQVQSR